jgi:hypothetical protein
MMTQKKKDENEKTIQTIEKHENQKCKQGRKSKSTIYLCFKTPEKPGLAALTKCKMPTFLSFSWSRAKSSRPSTVACMVTEGNFTCLSSSSMFLLLLSLSSCLSGACEIFCRLGGGPISPSWGRGEMEPVVVMVK